jgi:hypothetical protein
LHGVGAALASIRGLCTCTCACATCSTWGQVLGVFMVAAAVVKNRVHGDKVVE